MTEITQDGSDDDSPTKLDQDEIDYTRYGQVRLGDGQILLYDIDETESWIQSDVAVPLEDVT